MALGSLIFRARRGAVAARVDSNEVRLRGEVEWIASGSVDDIHALEFGVTSLHAERLSDSALLLRFGNSVGRFTVGALGTLAVYCGKWDDATFDAMLQDLTTVALSLPYKAEQRASWGVDRTLLESNRILLHAFLYARHIVLASDRHVALPAAVAVVLANPHRRFLIERARVAPYEVEKVDARSVARLASGAERMVRTPHGGRLAEALRGYTPLEVDVPHAYHSVDTAENRFVRAFLDELADIIACVSAIAASERAPFWKRVAADCVEMRLRLHPLRAHDLWKDVGRQFTLPTASSVLQRRHGYKELLRHHVTLHAATRLPHDDRLAELLGMKDVAALYELWCFFAVVRALELVIGRPPDEAIQPRGDKVQVDLQWGLRVSWRDEVDVYYNLTFSGERRAKWASASVELRPDIVVATRRASGDLALHVLDAKLRLDRRDTSDGEELKTYKAADIVKMHAYRDALPDVRTAFVLYPGDEVETFAIGGAESGAVGAIPVVPGRACEELIGHLRNLLANDASRAVSYAPVAVTGHET